MTMPCFGRNMLSEKFDTSSVVTGQFFCLQQLFLETLSYCTLSRSLSLSFSHTISSLKKNRTKLCKENIILKPGKLF